jgi:hypothetical protein
MCQLSVQVLYSWRAARHLADLCPPNGTSTLVASRVLPRDAFIDHRRMNRPKEG